MGVEKVKRTELIGSPFKQHNVLISGKDFLGAALAQAIVPLTAAQLTTLHSAPVPIIPAPYSNQIVLVYQVVFQFKYPASGGVQFTGGGAITFPYHGTGTIVHSGAGIANTVLQAASSSLTLMPVISANLVLTFAAGLGVDIIAAGANFAAGNGTAIVTAYYGVVTLG